MIRVARKILAQIGLLNPLRRLREFLAYRLTKKNDQFSLTIHSKEIPLAHVDTYTHTWLTRHQPNYMHWHEPSLTQLFEELSPERKTFMDVGSQLGYFSILHSALHGNESYAIELSPQNYKSLVAILDRVKIDGKIHAFNRGFGSSRDVFHFPKINHNSSMFGFAYDFEESKKGHIPVDIQTLDEFCAQQKIVPDFIKIDVEGAELEVLKGASQQIASNHPVLCVELHEIELATISNAVLEDIVTFLGHFDYRIFTFENLRSTIPTPLVPWSKDRDSANSFAVCLPVSQLSVLDRYNAAVDRVGIN